METNQSKTTSTSTSTSKPKSSTRRKPSTAPPKASAKAKRAATAASTKRKRAKASAKRAPGNRTELLSAEERARRIAVAAYFLAERRGFEQNHELDDWLAAERSL